MSCYTATESAFSLAYNDIGFASAHPFPSAMRSQTEAVEPVTPNP
jgi:hypothetical protein